MDQSIFNDIFWWHFFYRKSSSRGGCWKLILKLPHNSRRSRIIWTLSVIIKISYNVAEVCWTGSFLLCFSEMIFLEYFSRSIFVVRFNRFFLMYLCVLGTSHKWKDIFMLANSLISTIKHEIQIQIKCEYQSFNLLCVIAKLSITV